MRASIKTNVKKISMAFSVWTGFLWVNNVIDIVVKIKFELFKIGIMSLSRMMRCIHKLQVID